jgi:glycosyltransferase involved in cell wall biosynthesis
MFLFNFCRGRGVGRASRPPPLCRPPSCRCHCDVGGCHQNGKNLLSCCPILIITHDWPPIRTAGTERILRFTQYLPEFGYRPLILTTNRYGSLADDVDQAVFRAGDWVHNSFRGLRRQKEKTLSAQQQVTLPTLSNASFLGRLRDRVMVPDTKIGWIIPAVAVGKQVIQQQRPALIFSSSPPETTHLIAHRLSVSSGLPWIADLRDGWLFEPPNPSLRQGQIRRRVEARLERAMVEQAARIITATSPITEDLVNRYPQAGARFSTITNGYDEYEFDGLCRQRHGDGHFLLTYTGSLSASRGGTNATALFAGLALHRQECPETPLRLRFVGNIHQSERAQVTQFGIEDLVECLPPVSRREAHQHQLDADALLLVTAPGQRSVATLKLFEYIRAGRPILALAQGNAAAEIVAQDDLGILVAPDQPAAIAQGLAELLAGWRQGKEWPGFAVAQQRYQRHRLTQDLAHIFDQVLAI